VAQGKKGSKYKARGSRPTGRPKGTKKMPDDPNEYSESAHRTRKQAQDQSKRRKQKEKDDIGKHQKLRKDMGAKPEQEVAMKTSIDDGGRVTRGNATLKSRRANRRQGTNSSTA
jgi:hypothetical protein